MSKQSDNHWNSVYSTKTPDAVSWYLPHLETSLQLIKRVAPYDPTIIDVGGGESTLVDDLFAAGYRDLTVLDISAEAIRVSKKRFGVLWSYINWRMTALCFIFSPMKKIDAPMSKESPTQLNPVDISLLRPSVPGVRPNAVGSI